MVRSKYSTSLLLVAIFLLSSIAPILTSADTSGRAQINWSNEVTINSDYTVIVTDELVIAACTNVTLGNNARIFIEGRLTVEGTESCPVYFDYAGAQDHRGIQFNSSSNGRGSKIDNLSIVHSVYGITIYGSDPYIANLTVYDADDVGVDLFNSATPTIRDLKIIEAGQDWNFPTYWRYGIGLSIGAGSAPNVDGVEMNNLATRGLNFWGNSGGLFRNISIDNVTGATLALAAGIWVEDSRPLIESAEIDRADHGTIVRHSDDSLTTRAVIRDIEITNSMYKGLLIDKLDRTNYTNYQSAVIDGLRISGTGGDDAKTAGLATSTVEVNATGAWIENAELEDNDAVGLRLYFVDSTSTFTNWTINNTGEENAGAHSAGVSVRSSYFAAYLNNFEISNSPGPGIYSTNGGAIQGTNWNLHNNGEEGFYLNSAAAIVDGLNLSQNGASGVHINDARYVYLSNLSSYQNSDAGMKFSEANDIESTSGDISCSICSSVEDEKGIILTDSVDIYLDEIKVHDPLNGSAIDIDNSGLSLGVQGGSFHLTNAEIWTNNSLPAINIVQAEGEIDGLDMYGSHGGIVWDADHNVERQSIMSNVSLSGTACLSLSNHDDLVGVGNEITSECTGSIEFTNSQVNWSRLTDLANHELELDSNSHLHLHQPSGIDFTITDLQAGAWIDVAWDVEVWVVNNFSNGIPSASIDFSFNQLESNFSVTADQLGRITVTDLVGKRYTYNGETPYSVVSIDCSYDSVSNNTSTILDQNQNVWCHLPLQNQAPFLIWDTPVDEEIFPSQALVNFDASRTWDLDNDSISWEWTSSIDGLIGTTSQFNANDPTAVNLQTLSDGIHIITAKVCDDAGHCVEQNRTIELSNQPPVIVVSTQPGLFNDKLEIPITKPLSFSLNGTYDPENDTLTCTWTWPDHSVNATNCASYSGNISFADMTITNFILTLSVSDGINQATEWPVEVTLSNEMPIPSFTVERMGNLSEDEITLTSTSIDPENDEIQYLWTSSIDGVLSNDSIWTGHLSRGTHIITLSVNDGRMEHLDKVSENSTMLVVRNSPPKAVINSPIANLSYDSSHLFEFNSTGSGDWDSACFTFPENLTWHCAENEPESGSEWLIYTWESDLDGRLTEDGSDWLIFESYLSAGLHNVTFTIDDGINNPVSSSIMIDVSPSAPVLGLVSPNLEQGYNSSDILLFDISDSIDHDGDNFTFTLESNLLDDALLIDQDPYSSYQLSLPAGLHSLTFTMLDDSGLSRVENIELLVVESDPFAVIFEPLNNQKYQAGEIVILDSIGTIDADDDLTKREWRLYVPGENYPRVLSSASYHEEYLLPGAHHISLYVEDRREGSDETHINITVYSSDPDLNNLSVKYDNVNPGESVLVKIEVELIDPDGTTSHIEANLTNGDELISFNLTYDDKKQVWTGQVEIIVSEKGNPYLVVTAYDGEVFASKTHNFNFEPIVEDNSAMVAIAGGVGGFVILSLLIAVLIIRRRKKLIEIELADIDLIDNWGTFSGEIESIAPEDSILETEK